MAASLMLGGCNVFNSDSSTASTTPATASTSGGDVSTPPNQAPTADAGADHSVAEGKTDTLTGSGSDPDGRIVAYAWAQTDGPTVTLTPDANDPAVVTYTAPDVTDVTTLTFQLTVTDDSGATGKDSVTVTVQPTITLSGTVTDGVIANATVTVDVNGVSYTTFTDSSGNYEITVPTDNADAFMTATATDDSGVSLISLLGTFATLSSQGTANNSINITNVTTAQAVLIKEANGGQTPTDQSSLDELNKNVDTTRMLDLAVAIKLVIDNGYSLPSGVNNTLDLVSDPTVVDQFLSDVDTADPTARDTVKNEILSDPALTSGFSDSTVPAQYMTTLDGQYLYDRGKIYQFAGDHTGSLVKNGSPQTFTWAVDSSGVLVITFDSPRTTQGFCSTTGGTAQIRCDETDTTVKITLVTTASNSDTLLVETAGTLSYPNNDNTVDDPTTTSYTQAAIGVKSNGIIPFDATSLVGTWAMPTVGIDPFYLSPYQVALSPQLPGLAKFKADGTGSIPALNMTFTWKLDSDNALVMTLSDSSVLKVYGLRKDGIAKDALVTMPDPTSGTDVYAGLMVKQDSTFGFTNASAVGRYALFTGSDFFNIRLDSGGIGAREFPDPSTNTIDHQYDDGIVWKIQNSGHLEVDSVYDTTTSTPYVTNCTDPSLCQIFKARFWTPVAVDGSRVYVLEQQIGWDFDSTATTDWLRGAINFEQSMVRFYTKSAVTAARAARAGGVTDGGGLTGSSGGSHPSYKPLFPASPFSPIRN